MRTDESPREILSRDQCQALLDKVVQITRGVGDTVLIIESRWTRSAQWVRNRVKLASTSVSGALISSPARLAGGVAGDQPPRVFPDRRRRTSPGEPAF